MPRTIAIGDIHGSSNALTSILAAITPEPSDTIITLGDYIDRGMDSKGVIDALIELAKHCRLISILGNHDEIMLNARDSRSAFRAWMEFGGITTLDSYGDTGRLDLVPAEHFDFLESCVLYYETERHFFVHANYDPTLPLEQQDTRTLRWLSLTDRLPEPHLSGKIAIVGHTPQASILDIGHLLCIDTGCGVDGLLTAIEVETRERWHAS